VGFSFIPLPWGVSFLYRFPAWVNNSYFFFFFMGKKKKSKQKKEKTRSSGIIVLTLRHCSFKTLVGFCFLD